MDDIPNRTLTSKSNPTNRSRPPRPGTPPGLFLHAIPFIESYINLSSRKYCSSASQFFCDTRHRLEVRRHFRLALG